MMEIIEFYGSAGELLVRIETAMVPLVGSFVSIKKRTWKVRRVTYAVDYADNQRERKLRANIDLEQP